MENSPKKIQIKVFDPTGSNEHTVRVPSKWKIERFINEIRSKLHLPENITYDAVLKRTSGSLDPQSTIEEAGIQEDDVIRLRTTQEGGDGP